MSPENLTQSLADRCDESEAVMTYGSSLWSGAAIKQILKNQITIMQALTVVFAPPAFNIEPVDEQQIKDAWDRMQSNPNVVMVPNNLKYFCAHCVQQSPFHTKDCPYGGSDDEAS